MTLPLATLIKCCQLLNYCPTLKRLSQLIHPGGDDCDQHGKPARSAARSITATRSLLPGLPSAQQPDGTLSSAPRTTTGQVIPFPGEGYRIADGAKEEEEETTKLFLKAYGKAMAIVEMKVKGCGRSWRTRPWHAVVDVDDFVVAAAVQVHGEGGGPLKRFLRKKVASVWDAKRIAHRS